eukprot:GHVT01099116.1.p1 GENE.GHVT01099116.1~~GHVT01099116.1.p1  ORF type:complete len:138 (-),score=24.01 GHVT01099116.1:608-1021(-)
MHAHLTTRPFDSWVTLGCGRGPGLVSMGVPIFRAFSCANVVPVDVLKAKEPRQRWEIGAPDVRGVRRAGTQAKCHREVAKLIGCQSTRSGTERQGGQPARSHPGEAEMIKFERGDNSYCSAATTCLQAARRRKRADG